MLPDHPDPGTVPTCLQAARGDTSASRLSAARNPRISGYDALALA